LRELAYPSGSTLQDRFVIEAGSAQPFVLPDYDETSFAATRQPLIELARGIGASTWPSAAGARSTRSGI
jgi:hypothetical protein